MATEKGNKSDNGNTPVVEIPDSFDHNGAFNSQKNIIGILDKNDLPIEPNSEYWNRTWEESSFLNNAFTAVNGYSSFLLPSRDQIPESSEEYQNVWYNQTKDSNSNKSPTPSTDFSNTSLESFADNTPESFKEKSLDKNYGNLIYPIDAKYISSQDHILFQQIEYNPKSASLFSDKNQNPNTSTVIKKTFGTVRLPIPDGIQDSNQVAWNGDTLGPLAIMGLKASQAISGTVGDALSLGSFDPLKELLSKGGSALKEVLNDPATGVILKNQLTAMAASALPGVSVDPQALLNRSTGRIINQNLELLFSGQTLRTFSFAFMLLPRSQQESIEVRKIIRFFKQGMAPKKSIAEGAGGVAANFTLEDGSLFLKTPNVFKISYLNNENTEIKGLNKFKTCACQGVSVNYAPNGYSSYMIDSQPVMVTLSLNFQEVEPIFYDDYENYSDDDIGF